MKEIPPVYKIRSGSQTLTIPSMGLGVYMIPLRDTAEIVEEALKIGYRQFDTARLYGNETQTAEGIANFLAKNKDVKREDVFYTTKIWSSEFGDKSAQRAIDESLEDAHSIGYIDLFLIHTPESTPENRLATYKKLQQAVDSGKVKAIGVSNYGVKHLKELYDWPELKYAPVVNQIEINPWLYHEDITKFCKEKGILIQTYSPLMLGSRRLKTSTELQALATKYQKSPAQIVLRWNLQLGYIPLPKTARVERLKENHDIFDFELNDEEMKQLCSHDENFLCCTGTDPTKYRL